MDLKLKELLNEMDDNVKNINKKDNVIIVEYNDETVETYVDGLLHSIDDEPAIKQTNGFKVWFDNGLIHREKYPAVIFPNGQQEYWSYGLKWE